MGLSDLAAPSTTKEAIVVTSHFNPDFTGNGTINTIKLPDKTVQTGIDTTLDPDVYLKIQDGVLYALNQDTGTLRLYDPATLKVMSEIPTGAAGAPNGMSLPHEIYPVPGGNKIYVSLSGNDGPHAIGVLDKTQPNAGVVKFIDVPVVVGGKPEAASFYACKNKLYVGLQDWTITGTTVTYKPGRVGIIDLQTDAFEGVIQLQGQNPGNLVQAMPEGASACDVALVADGGQLKTVPDGNAGIEAVDVVNKKSLGFRIVDTKLMGRPAIVELVSSHLGFAAIYYDPQKNAMGDTFLGSSKVVAFEPTSGALMGDVTSKAGNVSFVRATTDHQLFVGVGLFAGAMAMDKLPQGLYIGPADGTMLGMSGTDIGGQTPAAIAFP
jgi:hypothetical protein